MTLANSMYSGSARRAVQPIIANRSVKAEFGRRVIDRIIERTQESNIDKKGKQFTGYSESYVKSLAFDIYGKSKSDVNLTLTSEMLSNMQVTSIDSRGVEISFPSQDQNDKAHGHINGIPRKYGKTKGKVVRDFFGLPEKEQQDILKETIRDFNDESFDFGAAQTNIENI